jgi:hypothetical protein
VDKLQALRAEAGARIERWLAGVERASDRGFAPVPGAVDLPAEVLADSCYWCDEVFSPDANPHDAPDVWRGVHLATRSTPDLLRHVYTTQGIGLAVTEGRNFILVEVDPRSADVLALPRAERPAAVHRVAEAIFRAPPSFQVPPEIDEGARFSTDDGAEPLLLAAWSRRVEGGVRGGRLYFLCYKKTAQRVGFARDDRWLGTAGARRGRGR